MRKYRDLIGGSIFFVFAAVYFAMALKIPEFNDGFVSSDFMPKIYGIIMMCLSAIQIIGAVMKLKKNEALEEGATDSGFCIEVAITFVFLILYVALLKPLGFVLSTLIFLLGMITLFVPKEKRSVVKIIIISVCISLAVYLIFAKGLSLSLPEGVLKGIL